MNLEQLGVVLLALLPKDGTPRSAAWLADTAMAPPDQVSNALLAPWNDRRVQYDTATDSYWLRREAEPGDAQKSSHQSGVSRADR